MSRLCATARSQLGAVDSDKLILAVNSRVTDIVNQHVFVPQVLWRRRSCLERFLLLLSVCLVVGVVVLLVLVASQSRRSQSQQGMVTIVALHCH